VASHRGHNERVRAACLEPRDDGPCDFADAIDAAASDGYGHPSAAPVFVQPVAVETLAEHRRRIGEGVVFERRSDESLSGQRDHGWRT
jgi:hypothetical protein